MTETKPIVDRNGIMANVATANKMGEKIYFWVMLKRFFNLSSAMPKFNAQLMRLIVRLTDSLRLNWFAQVDGKFERN